MRRERKEECGLNLWDGLVRSPASGWWIRKNLHFNKEKLSQTLISRLLPSTCQPFWHLQVKTPQSVCFSDYFGASCSLWHLFLVSLTHAAFWQTRDGRHPENEYGWARPSVHLPFGRPENPPLTALGGSPKTIRKGARCDWGSTHFSQRKISHTVEGRLH